jgi:hypothetical protein
MENEKQNVVQDSKAKRFNSKIEHDKLSKEVAILNDIVIGLVEKVECLESRKVDVLTDTAKAKTVNRREINTKDFLQPVEPFPVIDGKVSIDQCGNIIGDWRKTEDGKSYEQFLVTKQSLPDGGIDTVERVINTEYADKVDHCIERIKQYIKRNS